MAILAPLSAFAGPNEIKVFTDEIANYGEHNLETHINRVSRAGPTANNRATPLQVMPEYSYGLWHNWEYSLQLQFAPERDRARTNGYRHELQYVAPHDDDSGFYWGANMELANLSRNGEPRVWNVEIQPILGYRGSKFGRIRGRNRNAPPAKIRTAALSRAIQTALFRSQLLPKMAPRSDAKPHGALISGNECLRFPLKTPLSAA